VAGPISRAKGGCEQRFSLDVGRYLWIFALELSADDLAALTSISYARPDEDERTTMDLRNDQRCSKRARFEPGRGHLMPYRAAAFNSVCKCGGTACRFQCRYGGDTLVLEANGVKSICYWRSSGSVCPYEARASDTVFWREGIYRGLIFIHASAIRFVRLPPGDIVGAFVAPGAMSLFGEWILWAGRGVCCGLSGLGEEVIRARGYGQDGR